MMILRPLIVLLIALALCLVSWVFIIGVIIMVADVAARYREWRWYRATDWLGGLTAFKLRKSWCGRGVAISIWGDKARLYYRYMGYRWWHILPDGAPGVFLRPQFWKTVIGV